VLLNAGNVLVGGDIDVSVKNMRLYREETVLRCGFNVSLEVANAIRAAGGDPAAPPPANITLKFEKCELDDAQGDKRFANDFHLYIHLMAVPAAPIVHASTDVSMSSLRELASFHDVGSPDDKLLAPPSDPLSVAAAERADAAVSPSSSLTLHGESSLYLWRPPAPQNGVQGSVCFFDSPQVSTKVAAAHLEVVNAADMVTEKGGWLTKRGHVVKNWKRRWFVLNDDMLRYYKSPGQTVAQGFIALSDIWAVHSVKGVLSGDDESTNNIRTSSGGAAVLEDDDDNDAPVAAGQSPQDSCYFEIVTSGRNYVVQADNPREREDWIDTIRAALGRFSTYVNARRPIGKLHVRVSQAREVNAQSQLIYCVLQYAKQRHRTGMANAVLAGSMSHPIWIESSREVCFDVTVPVGDDASSVEAPLVGGENPAVLRNRFLSVSLWLESKYAADQCLGEAVIPLDTLPLDQPNSPPEWHRLMLRTERECGSVLCTAWIESLPNEAQRLGTWLSSTRRQPLPGAILRSKSQHALESSTAAAAPSAVAAANSSSKAPPVATIVVDAPPPSSATATAVASPSSSSSSSLAVLTDSKGELRVRGASVPPPSSIPSALREALDLPPSDLQDSLNSSESFEFVAK
jgi:hypothetical protein